MGCGFPTLISYLLTKNKKAFTPVLEVLKEEETGEDSIDEGQDKVVATENLCREVPRKAGIGR